MLRTFTDVNSTPAPAYYKASVAMTTGMGVVTDEASLTVGFPASEAGSGISLVDKERIPTGINTARGELSDYDDNFVNVVADEFVKLRNYVAGLSGFGTDQFDATGLAVNDRVAVGTDGKWKKATVPSIYIYVGPYNDNGHNLIQIKVADAIDSN